MLDTDARIAFSHGQFGGGVEKRRVVMEELWSCAGVRGVLRFSKQLGPHSAKHQLLLARGNPLVEFTWSHAYRKLYNGQKSNIHRV